MKAKWLPCLLLVGVFVSFSFADYADGLIDENEYEYGIIWSNEKLTLVVDGGGADIIEMEGASKLEVYSTSEPVNDNWNTGGITDIVLVHSSHLDYLGGSTEEITVGNSATATLKGGRLDYLTSMQRNITTTHIDLYCQTDWDWVYTNSTITGITGHWWDGDSFDIILVNESGYDPTWKNIKIITPEPATLALFGLGGLLIRKRR